MKINGHYSNTIRFESGSFPRAVSIRGLVRVLVAAQQKTQGTLENFIEVTAECGTMFDKLSTWTSRTFNVNKVIPDELLNKVCRVQKTVITFIYDAPDEATVKEVYRTGMVANAVEHVLYKFSMFKTFVGDSPLEWTHQFTLYGNGETFLNTGTLNYLFTAINEKEVFKKSWSYVDDMIKQYDYAGNLSTIEESQFRAAGYDFRHHHVHIWVDRDNDQSVILTIPKGKSATSAEIDKIYKIFRNYIYAYAPENTKFKLKVEGELQKDNKKYMWESDPNFETIY